MPLLPLVLLAPTAHACGGDQVARSAEELGIQVTEIQPRQATDLVKQQAAYLSFCFEKLDVERVELDVVRSAQEVTVTGAELELQECVQQKVLRWEVAQHVRFHLSFDERCRTPMPGRNDAWRTPCPGD